MVQNEILFAISALIGLGCYACVLYANKYERPAFYLPHIVINVSYQLKLLLNYGFKHSKHFELKVMVKINHFQAISIILSIIFYFIGLIAAAIFISKEKKEGQVSKDEVKGLAAGAIVVTAILLILYLIQVKGFKTSSTNFLNL